MTDSERAPHVSLIVSLFAVLFLIVLSFMLPSLASPYIVGDLGGDRTIAVYTIAFFGFGTAITIPLAKPLVSKWGDSKIFVFCIFAFAVASLLCAIAPTYFWLIAARLLAGMASGPFYPLLAHNFSNLVPPRKRSVIVWVFITILVVVPVVGACWGGSIAYLYHWRAPFYLNAAIAIPLAFIVRIYLKDIEIPALKGGFDWMGWVFYTVGIFSLCFAVATAQQLDWYRSPIFLAAVLIGLPCFGYYCIRSFTHETPVLDLRLFGKPLFCLAMLCLAVLFAIYFGMIFLFSLWLTLDVQFTPLWIGVLLLNMGIAGLFPRFFVEERFGLIDPRLMIAVGALLFAISSFYTTIFDSDVNFGRIACSRMVAGFGVAFFLPPIFKILSQTYAPERWVDVFAIFQAVRNLACGLGVAIFNIAWQRRTVFYHERLSERLAPSDATEIFFKKVEILRVPGDPLAQLNYYLDRRSSSLALDDVFYLMGWMAVGILILLALTLIFKRDSFNLEKAKWTAPAAET